MYIMNLKMGNIMTNKYVLYLVAVLALVNVIGLINSHRYNALALMVMTGFLSAYFTKNMIYVLAISILVTNFVAVSNNYIEGMKNKKEALEGNNKVVENNSKNSKNTKNSKQQNGGNGKAAKDDIEKKPLKQGFAQKNVPSSQPAAVDESLEDEEIGKRIDYASTLEQAYDNLQNIIGDDGIRSLTKDTQNLISQQKSLMGTMQSMAPMLKMAKDTLNNFNGSEMKDTMNSLKGMLGNLNITGNASQQ